VVKAKRVEQPTKLDGDLKIIILDRGWVFIGFIKKSVDDFFFIERAHCIRFWGTTDGIGQLALSGPTEKTKLDRAGTVTVPRHALIAALDVDPKNWVDMFAVS
jgi:hypothetical protein